MTYLSYYLPFCLVLYFLLVFVWPSYRIYKQTGINPVTFGNSDSPHDYIGGIMKIIMGMIVLSVLLFSFAPTYYTYLIPIPYLIHPNIQIGALVAIHLGMVWITIAQYQMDKSWRVGIDEANPTDLVTTGLFAFSRNPIFLGMLISIFGLFLAIPNAIMLLAAVASYWLIHIQIRLEEEFLGKQHGQAFHTYKQTTRRLLFV